MKLTAQFMVVSTMALAGGMAAAQERSITADFGKVRGNQSQVFRECIGAGRANEGLRADWQQQLRLVQREIGFKYIRMHGLLHDDMGVYKEDAHGNPIYNWQYIDQLHDFLLSVGLKPFVELGLMPADLASGKQTIFWWKGNTTPPKSYEKWAALIRALVAHFQERYGHDEVKTWYFEVWNEPDLHAFFAGSLEDYLKLYKTTAEAIKSVSGDYRVGGPASAIGYRFEEELVRYCAANGVPIDFVSTHCYGVKEGYLDETGWKGTVLDTDPAAVRSRMAHSRELIKNSKLPKLELHFTEWSSSYTPTDPIHDQYHQAAFILDKIKGAQEFVDSLSYWVFTDIFEENGPRMTPFHGGFGLLNYQAIKKPAYYAFQFLNRLGKTELVNADAASWIAKDEAGGVQALFWDFTPIAPPEGTNDQVFYKGELRPKPKGKVRLEIAGVSDGAYLMRVFRTGYRMNDAYTTYLDAGSPSQLTRRQVEAIKQANDGSPSWSEVVKITGSRFEREYEIRENDVYLVTLAKL
ncbi:MAG: GH39 family glycosyl hydrolase [Bryobacteraceae bacterium]